jgi:hypothetical protein
MTVPQAWDLNSACTIRIPPALKAIKQQQPTARVTGCARVASTRCSSEPEESLRDEDCPSQSMKQGNELC